MRKKCTIYNVQFTIKLALLLFTFYFLHFTFYIPIAAAADSTPSADIKTKLEELKKQIASKAAQLKQEINRRLTNKVYTGAVQSKADNSLTLSTATGPKTVSINVDTVFESNVKGKQKFSQKTISPGDLVAALGDVDDTEVLLTKKIILLPQNIGKPKKSLWGQVISISDDLITIRDKDKKNVAVSLPRAAKVSISDVVILTGTKNKDDIFDAGFVYIIPGVKAKVKKVATPSANMGRN